VKTDCELRNTVVLHDGWKFHRGDIPDAAKPKFDDSDWQTVRIPHDWAIAGPFDRRNDLQVTTIVEDGERKPSEHTGRTGGLPHVGVGWYRRRFAGPAADASRRTYLEFDGVMSGAVVTVNGIEVGTWPYGYASFGFDVTGYVHPGPDNLMAVRVENKPRASRWYPGAGIYRNVRLVQTSSVRVAPWGVCIRVLDVSPERATVRLAVDIRNETGNAANVAAVTAIIAPDGTTVSEGDTSGSVAESAALDHQFTVLDPCLWDVRTPHLYRAVTRLFVGDRAVDCVETTFGIRTARFDSDKGFLLNGRSLRLHGVCQHHDLGPLGAAVNRRAIERQLEILREMGCNAIRTSHNPPAPELLELCDQLGFVVIDEAFDEWKMAKVENGCHVLFDDWAEKDLRAMIRRDRNHPCVILWSVGNEIGEQNSSTGADVARFLTEICHDEDPTRPVTAGFNNSEGAIANGLADVVDVPGWNYKPHFYRKYHEAHPDWPMYGSETESCVSSRGEYFFPVVEGKGVRHPNLHCSSYDLEAPPWGCIPDIEFAAQDECPFIAGEFVWTGFDYLGEPTPYNPEWPSRSSYFGIVDLCGIPKDRYFLYRSRWSDAPTLHLLPHWNWPAREGEIVPVHCYTSYDTAELFLNGESLGVRRKDPETRYGRYRLIWNEVRYRPGTLRVVALDSKGHALDSAEVKTAGPASKIVLFPDRRKLSSVPDDLCFIVVQIRDDDGVLQPLSDALIEFRVDGPIEIAAVGSGDPTSLESFVVPRRRAFHGQCLLIVRPVEHASGVARISAAAEGLPDSVVELRIGES